MNLMLFARQLPSLQLLMVHTVALCDCMFQDKEGISLLSILDTSDLESVPRMPGLLQMEQLADHYQMDSDDLATEWKSLLDQLTDTAANDRTLPSVYKLSTAHRRHWPCCAVASANSPVCCGDRPTCQHRWC